MMLSVDWRMHTLSPAMQAVYDRAVAAAPTNDRVLIQGEEGVGKEVMARRIHALSARADKSFLAATFAGFPEEVLEVELFGVEVNALSHSPCAKKGLIEEASGGTLFLDEVGNLPPMLAGKLASTIENRTVAKVGSTDYIPFDVRFLASTSFDLTMKWGTRNPKRYLELVDVALVVPPLRERRSEIPELAHLFVEAACRDFSRPLLAIAPVAMARFERHLWPGNIRELRVVLERAVLTCSRAEIRVEDLFLTRA